MANKIKVVLFEDTAQKQSELLAALTKYLEPDGEALLFNPEPATEPTSDKDLTYEARLEKILGLDPYKDATLVLADQDLSKSTGFRGLSANAVLGATKRLQVPTCSYARHPEISYEWRGRWEEGHIVLSFSGGEDELARRATVAARGFGEIARKLTDVLKDRGIKSAPRILASLLGKGEYSEKIALYSVGDQNRVAELPEPKDAKRNEKGIARFLGYWLWDSLLRYPGVLVNKVAAASHLNIDTADFTDRVQDIFTEALYEGPFADPQNPQWWRGAMDDVVSREGCADGLELVHKKADSTTKRSQCWVDVSRSAGYYCIISEKPVSLENSTGGLSWFPRGADLTRISNPLFEEYGPWLSA